METERVQACPLCHSSARALLVSGLTDWLFESKGRWEVHRCLSCGAAFLDPRPTPATIGEAYARYYTHDETSGAQNAPASTSWLARLKRKVRNGYLQRRYGIEATPASPLLGAVVPWVFPRHRVAFDAQLRHLRLPYRGAPLLDVGCGSGAFLETAEAAGWTCTGLEIDESAAAVARRRGLNVLTSNLLDCRFPPAAFQAVTLNHVIEHLYDPLRELSEVHRILAPGGVAFIATPNLDSPLRHLLGAAWRGFEAPRHLVLFDRSSLLRLLADASFEEVSWPMAWPLTRWMYEQSDRTHRRMVPELALRALEVGSLATPALGEQLVVLARKGSHG